MEDKLDNGFIKNHFESPQYGESTFSDSGHVIYQDRILFMRWYVRIVQYAIDRTRCTVRLSKTVLLTPINSIIQYLNAKRMVNRN